MSKLAISATAPTTGTLY